MTRTLALTQNTRSYLHQIGASLLGGCTVVRGDNGSVFVAFPLRTASEPTTLTEPMDLSEEVYDDLPDLEVVFDAQDGATERN